MKANLLAALLIFAPNLAIADLSSGVTDISSQLMRSLETKEEEIKAQETPLILAAIKETPLPGDAKNQAPKEAESASSTPPKPVITKETNDEILDLVNEVEELKTKVVTVRKTTLATQNVRNKKSIGAKTIFNFQDGQIYEVRLAVDHVTDIELAPGESIVSPPVTGESVRFKLALITSGEGETATTHVILRAIDEGVETNILIPTNKRTYHLKVISGSFHVPAISWNYPQEEARLAAEVALQKKRNERTTIGVDPKTLVFAYDIEDNSYAWGPVRVFDNGEKTWIQMPDTLKSTEAPVLFIIDEDEENPVLVNYRVEANYYVLDRLFDIAELRVGPKKSVRIESTKRVRHNLFQRIFS